MKTLCTENRTFNLYYILSLFILTFMLLHLTSGHIQAAQTTLTWNPPVNADGTNFTALSGYKLHAGTASSNYSQIIDVGNTTTYTLNNLSDGITYFFSISDYDASGNESGNSNEVTKAFPFLYSLTATTGTGGKIVPVGNASASTATNGTSIITSVTVAKGSSQVFSITPDIGYTVSTVKVDGVAVGALTSYTFSNVTANHTLEATFAVSSYSLTATAGTGGSISPAGIAALSSGGSKIYNITPTTGYKLVDVKVDGVSVGAVTTYTFTNVTANHTIAASFSAITYSVTASSSTGGSITPVGTAIISSGASKIYTITPTTGYKIATIKVDGVTVGAVATYTFNNIIANHTIAATFTIISVDTNIAPLSTVTASSQNVANGQLAVKAVDGIISGYPYLWDKEWATVNQLTGAWINLSWNKSYTINKIVLYDRPNMTDQVLAGTLTFSDGSSLAVGTLDNSSIGYVVSFAAKNITWVKFTVTRASGTNVGLAEFQVFGQ